MSAKIEEPPDGYQPVTDDERVAKLGNYFDAVSEIASGLCEHHPKEFDPKNKPCAPCMKIARHVTEAWFHRLYGEYEQLHNQWLEGISIPEVGLDDAFFIVASRMEPELAVRLDWWGPL